MRDAGYGRIVNIASVAGKDGNPNASAYSASKAAVIGADQVAGQGTRRHRRPRELRDAGRRQDRDLRPDERSEHIQFMLSKIPDGPLRHAGRSGGAWSAGCAPRIARSPPARCSTCRAAAPRTDRPTRKGSNNETGSLWQPRQGKARPDRRRRQAARLEQRGAGHRPGAARRRRAWRACARPTRRSCPWCAARRASAARSRSVGKFIAIGLNYADHAAESGVPIPKEPVVFMKATSCIQGAERPGDAAARLRQDRLGSGAGRGDRHAARATCPRRMRWPTWPATA